ncbi:methyltransferase domain-containing protein [Aeromicrobium sp. Leaf350]|uniref:methyltransferase domain-containing protein n=1 Tax=Aeromicrobium sp. Leaf350 TaxID=2876565 RepID=UPI001E5752BE|nr:methyltransferase domain-containing protein [Aeromicrobium sp. Leaf350]
MNEVPTDRVEQARSTTPIAARMPFGDIDVSFDDSVLVPRPWTLAQATWARDLLDGLPAGPVLEVCSGAGHIGLAAVHGSGRRLVQVDQDETACAYARENAAAAGAYVDVRCGPMDRALRADESFVLLVADPPWVPTAEVSRFPDDPVLAIDGGEDGLDVARTCVAVAARHLLAEGAALLQLGSDEQVARLAPELSAAGLVVAEVRGFDGGAVALLRPAPARLA